MQFLLDCFNFFLNYINILLHIDAHLLEWISLVGPWIYLVLFLVVFCETGLVVTPFLPGDSLLFVTGALAAAENSPLREPLVIIVFAVAAIAGDAVNYSCGRFIGPKVFRSESSWFFNKEHLTRTQRFYDRHGGKTIIIARFVPIIRTFAPFVAGIGKMHYPRFALYNVTGGLGWVFVFACGGYYFGNIPFIKNNMSLVLITIILISVMPIVFELLKKKCSKNISS